jgi:hypothetical protein
MIINQLFIATLNRAGLAEADRVPFHLYVDEFQNFVSDTAAQMLAEARKYGLCLALANQNLSQLRANRNVGFDLVETILGNVGSLISFRIGPQDAERLQAYMRPEFACDDLQSLPNFTAIGRLMTSRCPTTPFAFTTLPPTAKQDEGNVPFPCLWEARSSYTISIRKKLETPEEAQERAEAIKARQAKEMEKTRQEALELLGL